MSMTREDAAELRVQDALKKIEAAQNLLYGACSDLSPIIGGMSNWKRVGKLGNKAHEAWRKLAYSTRTGWKLDREPDERGDVMDTVERKSLGDLFDRTIRALNGLPDVVATQPATVRAFSPVLDLAQTFIVQTFRQRDQGGTVFIEYIGAEGSLRLAIPPAVSATICRQHDALTSKSRVKAARAVAADRKARGIEPGFMLHKRKAAQAK